MCVCVRYVSFGCIAMGSAVLFILRSRVLLYSSGSGVNRVQVVLYGFSDRFVLAKPYVALDMSKAFDTINIHTLIRKLLQTNIPGTIIKFIANYIKGRKAYTTYRNHTFSQRQFKTGVPQGGVLLLTLFNIYTAEYHHQEHQFRSWSTHMTSPSHLHTQARVQPRNTYNHTYIKFLPGQNKTISH